MSVTRGTSAGTDAAPPAAGSAPVENRYARQTAVPEIGAAGQARLARARALVIGAGGLAAPALPYLAGAGVGALTIVDPDRVALSNLHRQTLFTEADVGALKAARAAEFCRRLNGAVDVAALAARLDPGNAPALVAAADVVIDCADSFAVSYALSDECLRAGRPLVSASALGLSGYVGGFCGGAPSLRAVFPALPARAGTCATAGVSGAVVGAIGALQAQMALSILLGIAPSPLGLLVQLDARDFRMSRFRFDGAAEPASGHRFIAVDAIAPEDCVIDLRGRDEAAAPVRPWALRRHVDSLDSASISAAPGRRLVLCCASGLRAWRAADRLAPDWPGPVALVAAGSDAG